MTKILQFYVIKLKISKPLRTYLIHYVYLIPKSRAVRVKFSNLHTVEFIIWNIVLCTWSFEVQCTVWKKEGIYSVWHLVVQILLKFFHYQNQFSLEWLNLQSNKNSFAHYKPHRVQKIFCLFIALASLEISGSE